MAAFTRPDERELIEFLRAHGLDNYKSFQEIAGGSVNSNFMLFVGGEKYFLRLYEEQDLSGAQRELAMVSELGRAGVSTPHALGPAGVLSNRPAAVFPWIEGTMRCQASVTERDVRVLGSALAEVHLAGQRIQAPPGRFGIADLRRRLERIEAHPRAAEFPLARLGHELDALAQARDEDLPQGLVHGDLFRDNVLWREHELAALLDFESAFRGSLVYDLAVTILAWCFGDSFSRPLREALTAGYESVRPLSARERAALPSELRFGAVRFTITRITDYALRGGPKDWRRFLARLEAL